MDTKKALQIAKSERTRAKKAGNQEKVAELEKHIEELERELAAQGQEAPKQEPEAEATKGEAKPDTSGVKLRAVLSDYFYARRETIKKELIESLKETFLREPVDVDSYGSYKPGVFTHGAFWVFVDYDSENHLWSINILPGVKGAAVGDYVIQQIRDKFIPDYAWMSRLYPPRGERSDNGVILYQLPSEASKEE